MAKKLMGFTRVTAIACLRRDAGGDPIATTNVTEYSSYSFRGKTYLSFNSHYLAAYNCFCGRDPGGAGWNVFVMSHADIATTNERCKLRIIDEAGTIVPKRLHSDVVASDVGWRGPSQLTFAKRGVNATGRCLCICRKV